MKIGIMSFAHHHAEAYIQNMPLIPGVEIMGLADDDRERGERMARQAIRRIPNGVYEAEDFIDGDGISDEQISIRVKITVEDEAMTVDFTRMGI